MKKDFWKRLKALEDRMLPVVEVDTERSKSARRMFAEFKAKADVERSNKN